MLVLARQRDQSITIGDDVEVVVVDIRGDKVRLGIIAPREVSVHRKEVYEAIRRENRAAAQVKPEDLPGFIGPKLPPKPQDLPKVIDVEISDLRMEIKRLCESTKPDDLRIGSKLFIQLAEHFEKATAPTAV